MVKLHHFMKATFVDVGVGRSGIDGGGGGGRGGGRAAAPFNDSDFVVVFLDARAEGDAEAVGHVGALVPGHCEDKPVRLIGVDLWGGGIRKGGGRGGGRRVRRGKGRSEDTSRQHLDSGDVHISRKFNYAYIALRPITQPAMPSS